MPRGRTIGPDDFRVRGAAPLASRSAARLMIAALAIAGCRAHTVPPGIPPSAPWFGDEARDEGGDDHVKDRAVPPANRAAWVQAHYNKREVKIPMRDGVELFTAIYTPKHAGRPRPILLNRTPYSLAPYGPDMRDGVGPSQTLAEAGFVFVYQDVRGRWMSGGEFVDMRPHRGAGRGPKDTDESSDTFDTIAWLVANVPNNNGKVGMWGISYPGFYAATGMIDHHPALVAVSPQAPIADWWFDDFHHHGALFLPHTFNFFATFGRPRPEPTVKKLPEFEHGTTDGYSFFSQLGSLANADSRYLRGGIPFWTAAMAHPNYDAFWQERNLLPHLKSVAPHVLVVGGWFDAEDLYGPLTIYKTIENREKDVDNKLVMGPWRHGGWARDDGRRLGCIEFGSNTAEHYRERIEAPFFRHHLDGGPNPHLAEASVFDTGAQAWRSLPSWPPPETTQRAFFLAEGGKLSSEAPRAAAGADTWTSDPNRPVPYTQAVAIGMINEYMVEDQRFAARRPDVLTYQTEPLTEDLVVAGPIAAEVWLSTTAADADVVVKLIDVLPDGTTMAAPTTGPLPYACPKGDKDGTLAMGGFQQMVRSEVFRARYRDSYESPKPMRAGVPTKIVVPLQDVLHTFRKGHRLMVQIQSTWFPLVDRNPQRWHDTIARAPDDGFSAATHRVHRSKRHPTLLRVGVLGGK